MTDIQAKRLAEERKGTDASLVAERRRLDDVVQRQQLSSDSSVDATIRKSRSKSDRRVDDERARQAAPTAAGKARQDEADRQQTCDRQDVDAAMSGQRHLERLAKATQLRDERAWTDARLRVERERTDLHFEEDAHRLDELKSTTPVDPRDEFLAVISHDLKSPLTGIMMGVALIADTPLEGAAAERVAYLSKMVRRATANALLLINDLLDAERIGVGRFQLHASTHDLVAVVRDCVTSVEIVAAESGVTLASRLPDVPVPADFDRTRLVQVLANLLANALKFTPRGGRIDVALTARDDGWEVSVEDTGPGIPAAKREEIFARYAQLKRDDRRGLGLGLYICKSIIEAHRGRIWADGEEGKGSRFTFFLPRLDAEELGC